MRLAVAIPEKHVTEDVLNAGLETTTRLDEAMLKNGEVPTFREGLRQYGIRWKPEPPGDERFDHAKLVIGRRNGDCDDLAPWHAASLRATGQDPGAQAVVKRSGPNRWHAVVKRSDGRYDDPSREAGMGTVSGAAPAVIAPMFPPANDVSGHGVCGLRPQLAARPITGGHRNLWEARADLPWNNTEFALSALHRAPVASTAICGAIVGAVLAAEAVDCAKPEHKATLIGLAALLDGHDPRDVADVCGHEATERAMSVVGALRDQVGFSFGGLLKSVAPFASKALSFVPGVGPIASTALDVATKLIPDGKGGHVAVPASHPTPGVPVHPMGHDDVIAPSMLPKQAVPPTVAPLPKGPMFMSVPGGPLVLRF